MLKRLAENRDSERTDSHVVPSGSGQMALADIFAAARRQARVLGAGALLGLLLGSAYLLTATPRYTAEADLLIDSQKDKNDLSSSIGEFSIDSGAVDSQVEVLKSEKIAISVISTLKLTQDAEFMGARGALWAQAFAALHRWLDYSNWFVTRSRASSESDYLLQREAIASLENNLEVRRLGHTYVIAIFYTSPDPGKAAAIASAFGEAYLSDQLDSKFEATRRASGWLQARIAELKRDSLASDSAVQKFKADKGLVTVGAKVGAEGAREGESGYLVSDQQLTELNTQLILAHSETAKAEARYNQISEMLKSGATDGAVTDSLGNPVITDLRQRYLQASKMASQLENKLGKGHLQVVSLHREMDEYRRLIFEELQRIAETYRSEGEVARAKENALNASMATLTSESAGNDQTLVQLRELEREAETYRSLYKTFLERYQETVQQQSFPITQARIITAAAKPLTASFPKRSLTLALSLALGSFFGAGLGALRETQDRVFRTASQVRDELGLNFLGMLPMLGPSYFDAKAADLRHDPRQIQLTRAWQRYSLDHPLSNFSEILRATKVAVDISLSQRKPKVVGVISVLPDEGKSTISKNFASLLAHLGAKTLLVDGDLRNPGLSRAIAGHAEAGILEALCGQHAWRDLLLVEPDSGLSFLPAVLSKRVHHASALLSSAAMQDFLTDAGRTFDYIVIDSPPLGPVVDVRAAAPLFDAFVFVAEWGRTSRQMVQTVFATESEIYHKCVGVLYNKVQYNQIHLYEDHRSTEYYHDRYNKYYIHDKEFV